jgi:tol-pal system-associated acyl-CoA thioesterase
MIHPSQAHGVTEPENSGKPARRSIILHTEVSVSLDAEKNPRPKVERRFECKVYYEDTDCMEVVYHANYLKYLERARTEYVEDRLRPIVEYHRQGYLFMVYKIEIVFHSPAKLGDSLVVRTWIESTTKFRVTVKQILSRKGEYNDYLVTATVTLVAVGVDGKLRDIPPEFHEL